MIDLIVNGRLGNQLFMYAMARSVQLETGDSNFYINTSVLEQEKIENSLLNYNISSSVNFYSKQIRTRKKGIQGTWLQNILLMFYSKATLKLSHEEIKQFEEKWKRFFEFFGVYLCKDYYREMEFQGKKSILLYGYFQSAKYFEKYEQQLKREFVPKIPVLDKNRILVKEIEETESVCVSVRLGDDFQENKMHNVCTLSYYRSAIEIMRKKLKNPKFYFFSDKTELLKRYFYNIPNCVFEQGNDPDYEKLRIMSKCKHFIIANSSFSWWAQYLGESSKKIVIAPSRWYNGKIPCDIYLDSWILVDPETGKEVEKRDYV